jgi:hypothetical protein
MGILAELILAAASLVAAAAGTVWLRVMSTRFDDQFGRKNEN